MINQDDAFLPFFFQEPVYLVPDPVNSTLGETSESEHSANSSTYTPLGSNHKQILLLVEETDVQHISETNLKLLEKILQSVQLSLNDVCLVNVAQAHTPDVVKGEVAFGTYIAFGMPPEAWQYCNFFKKYEVDRDDNGQAYLWADSLTEIAEDVEKKKLLWSSLKSLFLTE
jgi:hypothetical protein